MAAIIAFSTSLLFLVAFLSFKIFEQPRGLSGYRSLRSKADVFLIQTTQSLHSKAALFSKHLSLNAIAHTVLHRVASLVAMVARNVQVYAEDLTRRMNRNGNGAARTTKSLFFEEVVTHKNNLDTDRVRRETSL